MDADISFVKLVQDHVWDPHRRILVVTRWLETCVYGISHDWDLKACHAACVHLTHTQMQPYKTSCCEVSYVQHRHHTQEVLDTFNDFVETDKACRGPNTND